MKSILITGCNRGLGLGIIRHLIKQPNVPTNIITTCRNLEAATELKELSNTHKNINILKLDVRKTDTFDELTEQVQKIVGEDGLNVLFNNAGYAPKSTRINLVKPEQMLETFAVNTIGPLMLTKALLPLLRQASVKNSTLPLGANRAAVLNMTSYLGSVQLNDNGGLYPYRCSKAAINIVTKSLSIDLKNDGILVACIHPGWVQTEMGGANAPMTVDESVFGIVQLISNLNESHNGHFIQWDGKELPW